MDKIELFAGDKKIKIVVKKNGWSNIYFISDNKNIKLGANGVSKIVSKLLIALDSEGEKKYIQYKGLRIFTVFCLMEPHATIAGRGINNSELELLCIKDNGDIIPLVSLSINDIERWTIQLTDFILKYCKN